MPKAWGYRGYDAPSPIDGYPMRCYCIEIPDAPEYRRAFLNQIVGFTYWTSWQRDTENNARAVSVYLRSIIDPQLEADFMCNCLTFRNKPGDETLVQSSCDDGATWVDGFRLNGGNTYTDTAVLYQVQVNTNILITYNLMKRYDGVNPDSINPDCPNDFYDGDASADRAMALCMAVKSYVESTVGQFQLEAAIALGLVGVVGYLLSVVFPIATVVVVPLALLSAQALEATRDAEAIRDVICCMLAGLTGQAVTRVNFEASLDACGFENGSHAGILHDVILAGLADAGNWTVFIDALGTNYVRALAGVEDCPCGDGWEKVFDFENDGALGWSAYQGNPNYANLATFVSGYGWETGYNGEAPNPAYVLEILYIDSGVAVELSSCTEIEVYYFTPSATMTSDSVGYSADETLLAYTNPVHNANPEDSTLFAIGGISGSRTPGAELAFAVLGSGPNHAYIHKVVYRGYGVTPF